MTNAFFIAGTDTSVGKTFISALLLRFLHAKGIDCGYQKWVSTGGADAPDLQDCLGVAGIPFDKNLVDLQVPYRFIYPASPHLAAEMENRQVEPAIITERFQQLAGMHELLIIEGVGGLLVPLTRHLLLADLLASLRLPTIVVARSGLGTLNHTLLTLEALRSRNIPVLGIIFSDSPQQDEIVAQDNIKTIAELGTAPILGRVPRCKSALDAEAPFVQVGETVLRILRKTGIFLPEQNIT